ncbi:MAG TPA: TonB-dependent receptor [Flavisolibacter sp.]|jgi:iron complex outermembrane receptor protein|nr:TonB-dependent receptor [Flavisolibacter sp.]
MKKILFMNMVMLFAWNSYAQYSITLSIKKAEDKQPIAGATATIAGLNKMAVADSSGMIRFATIAEGNYTVVVSHVGLKKQQLHVIFPQQDKTVLEVLLEETEEHEEEVIVTATRISRTITNTPTRTEVITGEELAEKGNMKPGDIRMMLNESTGVQTQQTSATSFNAGIRIQGLEGRYTQILRDGYPLYSGFSGGLSILQITPLDLKQVEVIKGAASTLYGGGAIAGLVNLVSKTPGKQRELSFLANGTTAGGVDLSGFYSQHYGKAGLTMFASRNSNKPFDPADIGLTAIPKFERYTFNPRLFLYGKRATADLGITYITEDRTGGSMSYIKNGGNGFFEKNNTDRITTQIGIAHKLNEHATLQVKNSYSHFNRIISIPTYTFDALQQSSFSELTWNSKATSVDWVIGANILTDDLQEKDHPTDPKRDYHYNTYGVFVQNAWSVTDKFTLESGLRGDYVNRYGFELLPRLSATIRLSPKLATRLGGGFGYKSPTIFTEDAERIQFQNLLPIDVNKSKNERSVGANWDINYKTHVDDVGVSFNQLFFYTRLNSPLVMVGAAGGKLQLHNSTGHLDTKGMETNLRLVYEHFKLFIGYTFTDANTHYTSAKEWLPLTAKHRLNNVLMYEVEGKLKLGLEAYYYSKQRLSDGRSGKQYWITGFMAEKFWDKFSIFINFENFTDTRQSRFDTIYTGTINHPVFRDIYAPVEGFVTNGGVKVRL